MPQKKSRKTKAKTKAGNFIVIEMGNHAVEHFPSHKEALKYVKEMVEEMGVDEDDLHVFEIAKEYHIVTTEATIVKDIVEAKD